MDGEVLVIGVGNPYRRDLGAGTHLVRQLAGRLGPPVRLLEGWDEGFSVKEDWQQARLVILVDAVRTGAAPGTVHRFEAHRERLPLEMFPVSTHSFGWNESIELARKMGRLPARVYVYAIEAQADEAGTELSAPVAAAVTELANRILAELAGR